MTEKQIRNLYKFIRQNKEKIRSAIGRVRFYDGAWLEIINVTIHPSEIIIACGFGNQRRTVDRNALAKDVRDGEISFRVSKHNYVSFPPQQ